MCLLFNLPRNMDNDCIWLPAECVWLGKGVRGGMWLIFVGVVGQP